MTSGASKRQVLFCADSKLTYVTNLAYLANSHAYVVCLFSFLISKPNYSFLYKNSLTFKQFDQVNSNMQEVFTEK